MLFNSYHSMPKLANCNRSWILFSLLLAAVYLCFGTCPADAAQLLDVRIGEYDGYTRVVFELDAPSVPPQIETQSKGELRVVFDHTDVKLIRKIPVERSRHIDSIRFWQSKDKLSTVLQMDYPHFRYETFPLTSPPRIAVDIIPIPPPVPDVSVPPREENPVAPEQDVPVQDDMALPETERDKVDPVATEETEPVATEETEPVVAEEIPTERNAEVDNRPANTIERVEDEPPKMKAPVSDEVKESTPPASRSKRQMTFRLQFFLVIGLVVITIGILFLLLMLLFARHRLSEVKSKLSAGDLLREQDKKIDAINSRIQEQFERYDKA